MPVKKDEISSYCFICSFSIYFGKLGEYAISLDTQTQMKRKIILFLSYTQQFASPNQPLPSSTPNFWMIKRVITVG